MAKASRKNIPFGISLPKEYVNQIDLRRGDIPRSKFILRLLEINNREKIRDDPVSLAAKDQQISIIKGVD
jgi:hypothetical protein